MRRQACGAINGPADQYCGGFGATLVTRAVNLDLRQGFSRLVRAFVTGRPLRMTDRAGAIRASLELLDAVL